MDVKGLLDILNETTEVFRKGGVVVEEEKPGLRVTHVYGYRHADEAVGMEMVDCHFVVVGVDKVQAETHAASLLRILDDYPRPERLAGGPSYIEIGGELGDQEAAFRLFALGKVLGLWGLITPELLHFTGPEADEMAGRGFVMITGYQPGGSVTVE